MTGDNNGWGEYSRLVLKELEISVPLVVRLEGTNVEEGKAILEKSDVDVIAANDLDDAVKKIVKLV